MKVFNTILGLLVFCMLVSCAKEEKEALIETSLGNIRVKLYNETPKHRDNFEKLVKEGFYDGLLFHRVMPTFMVQGGDPDSKDAPAFQQLGQGGPGYFLEPEILMPHKTGALAAARLGDQVNPTRESSGSQFFIVDEQIMTDENLDMIEQQIRATIKDLPDFAFTPEEREMYKTIGGAPFLDKQYTVFGEVIEGMDVVKEIARQQRDPNNRPLKDITMKITMQ